VQNLNYQVERQGRTRQDKRHLMLGYTNPGRQFSVAVKFCTSAHKFAGIAQPVYDSLRTGRSGDRIPVGASFSAPLQNSPGVHSSSCKMSTGSFPGIKRPGHGFDNPPQTSAEVKERVELCLYYPSGSSWPVPGCTLPFIFYFNSAHNICGSTVWTVVHVMAIAPRMLRWLLDCWKCGATVT
jgi:hypothetical protein